MQLPKLENKKKQNQRPTKLTKEKSTIKRGNKPQAPLTSEQRCPALAVWLVYLRFASLKGHGSSLCVLPHGYLAKMESDIYVLGFGV